MPYPQEVILVIFSTPLVAINVTIIIHIAPNIPNVWVEPNPNNDHVAVLSVPNIKLETGINKDDETLTIHII